MALDVLVDGMGAGAAGGVWSLQSGGGARVVDGRRFRAESDSDTWLLGWEVVDEVGRGGNLRYRCQ